MPLKHSQVKNTKYIYTIYHKIIVRYFVNRDLGLEGLVSLDITGSTSLRELCPRRLLQELRVQHRKPPRLGVSLHLHRPIRRNRRHGVLVAEVDIRPRWRRRPRYWDSTVSFHPDARTGGTPRKLLALPPRHAERGPCHGAVTVGPSVCFIR